MNGKMINPYKGIDIDRMNIKDYSNPYGYNLELNKKEKKVIFDYKCSEK